MMNRERNKMAQKIRNLLSSTVLGSWPFVGEPCRQDPSTCCGCNSEFCYCLNIDCVPPTLPDCSDIANYIRESMGCDKFFDTFSADNIDEIVDNMDSACVCSICNGSDPLTPFNWNGPPSNPQCDRCKNLENGSGIDGRVISNEEFEEKTSSPKRLLQELKTCIQCPLLGNTERAFWDEDLVNGGANPRWRECISANSNSTDMKACPCEYQDNICSNGYRPPSSATGTPGSDDDCRDNPKWSDREFDPANMNICNLSCRCSLPDCKQPELNNPWSQCNCPPHANAPAQCAFGKGCTDYSRNLVLPDNVEKSDPNKNAHGNCWGLICPDTQTTPAANRIRSDTEQCTRDCDPSDNLNRNDMPLSTYLLQCDKDSDCSRYNAYCCPTGLCGTSDEMCYENIYVSRNAHNELPPNMDGI